MHEERRLRNPSPGFGSSKIGMAFVCIHSNFVPVATLLFVVRYDLIPFEETALRRRVQNEVRWPQPCFFNDASRKSLSALSHIRWSDVNWLDVILRLHSVLAPRPTCMTDRTPRCSTVRLWNQEVGWLRRVVMVYLIQPLLTFVLVHFLDQTFQFRSILREIDASGLDYSGGSQVRQRYHLPTSNIAVLAFCLLGTESAENGEHETESRCAQCGPDCFTVHVHQRPSTTAFRRRWCRCSPSRWGQCEFPSLINGATLPASTSRTTTAEATATRQAVERAGRSRYRLEHSGDSCVWCRGDP